MQIIPKIIYISSTVSSSSYINLEYRCEFTNTPKRWIVQRDDTEGYSGAIPTQMMILQKTIVTIIR